MSEFPHSENPTNCMEHPLQITVILKNVFGYDQSAKALYRNRLVCKAWHEANYYRWLEIPAFPVLCYHPRDVSNISIQTPLMDLDEFCNHFKKGHPKITRMLTSPPYGMELHDWELFSGDLSLHDLDSWFWSLSITLCLTKLTLSSCNFTQTVHTYQKHFLEKLPNLQTLAIKNGIVRYAHKMSLRTSEHENPRSVYKHLNLRYLEISLTFACPKEIRPNRQKFLRLPQFPNLCKLKLTLSNYPDTLPKELIYELAYRKQLQCLVYIDLLDFSKEAHEFGSEIYLVHCFPNLEFVTMDLGFMPERQYREFGSLNKLVLYRAPFHEMFPSMVKCERVGELELWGNVSPDMELQLVKWPSSLTKLIWNTRCYDNQHNGKRLQHLLNGKQKSYPLFTYDLVERATKLHIFSHLYYLDIDFGPLSKESWARLGQHVPNPMTLKAVFGKDHDLLLVSQIWPNLLVLEIKHRSRVSLSALMEILPTMAKLRKFCWKSCACTSLYFTEVNLLKEMENLAHALWKNVELPWKWNGNTPAQEEYCLEAEFENKLLVASNAYEHLN